MRLKSLLVQRRVNGSLTFEQKQVILDIMRETDSLKQVVQVLQSLYDELERELAHLTDYFGSENFQLELILEMLKIAA
jgi:hypothetical protein